MADAKRMRVFTDSGLNRSLCDIQELLLALGDAAEQFLAAQHLVQYQTALSAAGLVSHPTYQEVCGFENAQQAVSALNATARLAYNVIAVVARPDYDGVPSVSPEAPITLVAKEGS